MRKATDVAKLTESIQVAHNTARINRGTSLRRMKRNYDVRVMERLYEEGDLVYILDTAVLEGKCRKLCAPWKDPGTVVSMISPSLYRLQLKNGVFVANHDRLKPCKDRILDHNL